MAIGIFAPASANTHTTGIGIVSPANAHNQPAKSSTGRRAERHRTSVTFNRDGSITFHRSNSPRRGGWLHAGRNRTPRGR